MLSVKRLKSTFMIFLIMVTLVGLFPRVSFGRNHLDCCCSGLKVSDVGALAGDGGGCCSGASEDVESLKGGLVIGSSSCSCQIESLPAHADVDLSSFFSFDELVLDSVDGAYLGVDLGVDFTGGFLNLDLSLGVPSRLYLRSGRFLL